MTISPIEAEASLAAIAATRRDAKDYLFQRGLIVALAIGGVAAGLLAAGAVVLSPADDATASIVVNCSVSVAFFVLLYRQEVKRGRSDGSGNLALRLEAFASFIVMIVIWGALHYGRIALHFNIDQANCAELVGLGLLFAGFGHGRGMAGLVTTGLVFGFCGLAGLIGVTVFAGIHYEAFTSLALLGSAWALSRVGWSRAL